jgi:urease accessory protein
MVTVMVTHMAEITIIMTDQKCPLTLLALLRQQSWLSPAFPTGAYSYSHGIEWAVEAGYIHNRDSLVDWLEADLRYGSGRNEAIFFLEAWKCATNDDRRTLVEVVELAAAFRGTSEFVLESSQQAIACMETLQKVWPGGFLDRLSELVCQRSIPPTLSIVLGIRLADQRIPRTVALVGFLQSYIANLVTAGTRLVPLGQTDAQCAIAALEEAVLTASAHAQSATISDLGSAAFMVDLASASHETQYTRLFRS